METEHILRLQREYFQSGETLSVAFRIHMLKKLYAEIQTHEEQIAEALLEDLGKSDYESFMCEIGMALHEIHYMIKHVTSYAKRKFVPTPLAQFPAVSYKQAIPYGNVLIMSPWNYPLLLTIGPLANAIAAGNTAIIKPSAYAPATANVIQEIIEHCFETRYVAVVLGGRKENARLLEQAFDMIFFTGSQAVGKEVLRHAAEKLTPVVLELGGKSPCIVDRSANIKMAAKRIVFGKFLNCGQTCVAPDYILCDRSIKAELLQEICAQISAQYGENPLENPDYGRIINRKHFDRLIGLMDQEKIVFGGKVKEACLQIEPTVMDDVCLEDAVMGEEIFGPILPILTYEDFSDIFPMLQMRQKPLALYLFSRDKNHIRDVNQRLSYGGGCINDVVVHLATSEMGFGGVGESGMGSYHGKSGFDAFSHSKSILHKRNWMDLPMRYQPYRRKQFFKLIRQFLK